jgi:hypothetical protein
VFPSVLPTRFVPIQRAAAPVFKTHSLVIFRIHFPNDFTDPRIPSVNTFQNFVPNDCHFVNTPDRDFLMSFGMDSIDSRTHLVLCATVDIISVPTLPTFIGIFTMLFLTLPSRLHNFDFGACFELSIL